MKRREIFAGNWKMYTDYRGASDLVGGIIKGKGDIGNREIIVFPPSVYVRDIVKLCANSIDVGVQNMYYLKEGAFTGEISPQMVKDIGARYILIGHSERRHKFRETDEMVNKKIKAAFEFDIEPVVCVGEMIDEREDGRSEEVVEMQLKEAFSGITEPLMQKTIIAYEPVWAIGTGRVATPEIAGAMHKFIRGVLGKLFSNEVANILPILYGGSVKPDNIARLFSVDDIDGVLVGGASLKIDSFLDIIHVK